MPREAEDALDLDNLNPSGVGDSEDNESREPSEPEEEQEEEQEQEQEQEGEQPEEELAAQPSQSRPRQVPRSEARIRTLAEESRRKDQELAEVRNRLDALTAQIANGSQQQETPEQRATRLALLSPEERIREEFRESQSQHTRDMQLLQFQLAESSDKASFEAKATVDPLYKKWAPEVERELANLRRKNQNVAREDLFYYLVGKAGIQARDGAGSREQRRAAESRMRRASTRAPNSRSDIATQGRTRQQQSLEKRLENVAI